MQRETGTAILLITHNLGLVAENCDDVAVMYAGKVVERAPKRTLFRNPRHPYTQGLLRAVPRLDHPPKQPLATIAGMVPNPLRLPTGCRFRARCPWAIPKCAEQEPPLQDLGDGPRLRLLDPAGLQRDSAKGQHGSGGVMKAPTRSGRRWGDPRIGPIPTDLTDPTNSPHNHGATA